MSNTTQSATFAGGCFWCTEALFARLKGVRSALPGYTGGHTDHPTYEDVASGDTGHAEAIQIEFNPAKISYEKLLDVFMHTHNPTTLNQQDNDTGTQYRSAIFYHDEAQRLAAEKAIDALAEAGEFSDPIVTEVVPFETFYPAENYHRDYYEKNQNAAYCTIIISPKIRKLLKLYASDVQDEYKHAS